MKPIYFPDAFIFKPILRALFSCFQQIVVYQPARKLVPESLLCLEKEGRLEIRVPEEDTEENLPNLLKAYHAWADLHRGEPPDFQKFSPLHTPGPDDTSGAWIRSKIRKGEKGEQNDIPTEKEKAASLLQRANLFLAISQEYDTQRESLSDDLIEITAMERDLLKNIVPDPEQPSFMKPPPSLSKMLEAERPMPAERLAAWCRLYAHHHRRQANQWGSAPIHSPFFISADQATLDLLTAPSEGPEVFCRIFDIPLTGEHSPFAKSAVHESMCKTLQAAADGLPFSSAAEFSFGEKSSRGETTFSLTLSRVKGNCMTAHLDRLCQERGAMKRAPEGDENHHSLLGCILLNQHA